MKTLALRGVWMLLGYALAVLVATTVVCLFMGLPTVLPDQGRYGSFHRYLQDFPAMFVVGSFMTGTYGLPGWLTSVIVAEYAGKQSRRWFAVAGVFTALLALALSGFLFNLGQEAVLNVSSLVGGFFGGISYWAVAGKNSGAWRTAK